MWKSTRSGFEPPLEGVALGEATQTCILHVNWPGSMSLCGVYGSEKNKLLVILKKKKEKGARNLHLVQSTTTCRPMDQTFSGEVSPQRGRGPRPRCYVDTWRDVLTLIDATVQIGRRSCRRWKVQLTGRFGCLFPVWSKRKESSDVTGTRKATVVPNPTLLPRLSPYWWVEWYGGDVFLRHGQPFLFDRFDFWPFISYNFIIWKSNDS